MQKIILLSTTILFCTLSTSSMASMVLGTKCGFSQSNHAWLCGTLQRNKMPQCSELTSTGSITKVGAEVCNTVMKWSTTIPSRDCQFEKDRSAWMCGMNVKKCFMLNSNGTPGKCPQGT